MNTRERFLATMDFEKMDRPLYWECGFWAETIEQWYEEGLPKHHGDFKVVSGVPGDSNRIPPDVADYFGFDPHYLVLPVETRHLYPGFKEEVLEEHDGWVMRRNRDGAVEKAPKDHTGMRAMVRGAVQTRDDWEQIKEEHLRPELAGRIPDNFDDVVRACQNPTRPVWGLHCEHWLNLVEYVGLEKALTLTVEDPEWLKDMLGHLTSFFLGIADQVLDKVVPDACWVGGDFCYKSGPLMSPAAFREFLMPEFAKVADYFHGRGVRAVFMHTDGDCRPLLPHFREAGVDGVHPFEVTNGQNIVEVRKSFPDLVILGGIDKKAVGAGKEATDHELEGKIPFMLEQGGFIPYIDHAVPPSISWEDFVYYRRRLKKIVEREVQPVAVPA